MSPKRSSAKKSNARKNADPAQASRLNVVGALIFIMIFAAGFSFTLSSKNPAGAIAGSVLGLLVGASPRIANQWERAVVLRLGKYRGLDRSTRHHDQLQGRGNVDLRYRAGEC